MRQPLLPGNICISRPSGNYREDDYIRLELMDEASNTRFAEIEVSALDFMLAITGCAHKPMQFRIAAERVGWKAESQQVEVERPVDLPWSGREDKAAEVLAAHPLAKDGWVGDASDLLNHHRHTEGNRYRVTFRRHVHPETGEPFIPPPPHPRAAGF